MVLITPLLKKLVMGTPKTDDPKDWPNSKKYTVVFVIAYCAFVAPLASGIYMPAIIQMKDDLNTSESMISATLSVYILILGIMPVFWASLCDYTGRRPIYLVSMVIFIIGSLLAAIAKNIWVFFAMRAIQAFGASSVLSVGGGSLSDIFHSGERGAAFGFYYLGPLVAPMIGPVIGGVLADRAETHRKHIDEKSSVEKSIEAVDTSNVSRSHIYSTHSDPTLVSSKASLDSTSSHVSSSKQAAYVPLSIPSDRMSILSVHSSHSNRSHDSSAQVESAMEFIVPNFVPPYMMQDNVDETNDAEGSGNSSILDTKDKIHETNQNTVYTIPKSDDRHVVFSNEKLKKEMNEKQTYLVSKVPENMTDESKGGVEKPPKRQTFNPLRPLYCLKTPTNFFLVAYNALALGAQLCISNTLPIAFHDLYNMNESIIGVCFCVSGLGSVIGSLVGGRYSDYVMKRWLIKQELKRQRDERDRQAALGQSAVAEMNEKDIYKSISVSMRAPPEVRIQSVWLGVFILPVGLLLFGWSVQNGLPLPAPLVGIFLFGFGLMMVFSSTTTALVDANADNNLATAAVACNSFARGVTGAIAGFTALPLKGVMGSGWLYTFWTCLTVVGASGLVLTVVKAKSWREKEAEKALNNV
ncbi:hypothetical protein BGZ76_005165 [Entomortierella beljakovae]|nr:hypothetical protein BGZ76_005165 [Entomortierella beljakovae]